MRTIKAAVVGTGFMGPAHTEALRRLGFVEVVALVASTQQRAEQRAADLGIPRAYGDYREMLKDPEIEVVHNCTPNYLHFEVNTAILEAGKHCVSEKPLATSTKESRALVALADRSGRVNAVNFNYRCYPMVQQAKAMCDAGEVGQIYGAHGSYLQDWLYLDTDYNWRLEPKLSGPSCVVGDIGSHWCDLLQFITGRTITEVLGRLSTTHKVRKKAKVTMEAFAGKLLRPEDYEEVRIENEDYATVMFALDNGAHGAFVVSQVSAGRKNRLWCEIDGSACALALDLENPNELWIGRRDRGNKVIIKDPSLLADSPRRFAHYPGGHPEGYPDGFKNMFLNVYRRILGAAHEDFPTFAEGHRAVAIVEAILASHRSRQWTKVAY